MTGQQLILHGLFSEGQMLRRRSKRSNDCNTIDKNSRIIHSNTESPTAHPQVWLTRI